MSAGLGSFLAGIAATVTKRAMVGIGMGVVSFAALSTALQAALSSAKAAWGGLTGDVLAMVQIAGASTALSILAGGLVASVSVMLLKRFEVR